MKEQTYKNGKNEFIDSMFNTPDYYQSARNGCCIWTETSRKMSNNSLGQNSS